MLQQVNNVQDVITFIEEIAGEIADFNPFEQFASYKNPQNSQSIYTEQEAAQRDQLMERCFEICKRQSQNFICLAIVVFQEARDYPPNDKTDSLKSSSV